MVSGLITQALIAHKTVAIFNIYSNNLTGGLNNFGSYEKSSLHIVLSLTQPEVFNISQMSRWSKNGHVKESLILCKLLFETTVSPQLYVFNKFTTCGDLGTA